MTKDIDSTTKVQDGLFVKGSSDLKSPDDGLEEFYDPKTGKTGLRSKVVEGMSKDSIADGSSDTC